MFPQSVEEFENIYNNEKRVEVTMTNSKEEKPNGDGWGHYAEKVEKVGEEEVRKVMWFRVKH